MNWGDRLDRFSVVVTLAAMAVSRPLLELFGDNAEFFLTRRAPASDIVVVGLVLGIAIPLVLGLSGLLGGTGGRIIFLAISAALAAVLMRLFVAIAPIPDWLASLVGITAGIALVWAIGRFAAVRMMARYLVVAPLLFTALFLFFTPTASLLAGDGYLAEGATADRPAPLVWIVFDELPAASLMDSNGDIYRDRYPNFGRLADAGIWFPNAVTVQQQTEHSVPAILTGVDPDSDLTPYAGQYPNNIFTALAESHDLAVYETLTRLCPITFCNSTRTSPPSGDRAQALATDIAVVAGHTLLPYVLSDDLPPINNKWGYFGKEIEDFDAKSEFNQTFDRDPRTPLSEAATRITQGFDGRPPFLFVHALVPHHPWQLLPTGQQYPPSLGRTAGTTKTGWMSDSWLIDQGMQRHLLNVGYADYALGQILERLDEAGLFAESMIIVVADHGIAIREDVEQQRQLTDDTIGEIAAVPLLIKVPGTPGGQVDGRRALTIDIVPTVAAYMDVELPWQPEGVSLLGPAPERTETTTHGPSGSVTYGVEGREVLEVAGRLADDFPEPDVLAIQPPGTPEMVGDTVESETLTDSGLSFQLNHFDWYTNVNPNDDSVPVWVSGRIKGDTSGEETFAIVVNRTVVAISRAYLESDLVYVQALIPPASLRHGGNRIELALWTGEELQSVKTLS